MARSKPVEEKLEFKSRIADLEAIITPEGKFNLMVEAILPNGKKRTVGHSFVVHPNTTLAELSRFFAEPIQHFEEQSGTGEESGFTEESLVRVYNISSAPNPEAIPFSSDPANLQWVKSTKEAAKLAKTTPTLVAINKLELEIVNMSSTINTGLQKIVQTIERQSSQPVSQPSIISGINWSPIIQGLISGMATSFGANVNFPTSSSIHTPEVQSPQPNLDISSILNRLNKLESNITLVSSNMEELTKNVSSLTSTLNTLAEGQATLQEALTLLIKEKNSIGSNNDSSNGGGNSSVPVSSNIVEGNVIKSKNGIKTTLIDNTQDSKKSPPYSLLEIEPLVPSTVDTSFESQIVTADLEAIITPEGKNIIYMAAWYNGSNKAIFNISDFAYNTTSMLEQFWLDLIKNNKDRTCYFHNWGGYDSILSMASLFNLPGYTFDPMVNNGEVMCLTILYNKGVVLTIKDSIRILPGALGRLAKDWKVETQKEHFPHYFFLNDIKSTLNYVGPLPSYSCFEPKRTSVTEYEAMLEEFKKGWNFTLISEKYILGDVKALYQILIAFFQAIVSKFPINPLQVLSAPSTAFKIWRTVQLPILKQEGLKVYDLSYKSQEKQLREAYLGGIVDVYRPHLIGEGYYYDVNSLYPTAMSKIMPVGMPTLVHFHSISDFETSLRSGEFFGFVQATVQAPSVLTHAGYIGLLSIKYKNRLICPGGTFTGMFFSEELLFALNNGYTLLSINLAIKFQRGENTFKQLIERLNEMKIQAQLNSQPTIRNIAKLLMNSMYGRFGMKTEYIKHEILDRGRH